MYKITKTIGDSETINLVFDDADKAKKVFSDLRYDEFIRFRRLYDSRFNKETREEIVNGELVYSECRFSTSTFYVEIVLKCIEN